MAAAIITSNAGNVYSPGDTTEWGRQDAADWISWNAPTDDHWPQIRALVRDYSKTRSPGEAWEAVLTWAPGAGSWRTRKRIRGDTAECVIDALDEWIDKLSAELAAPPAEPPIEPDALHATAPSGARDAEGEPPDYGLIPQLEIVPCFSGTLAENCKPRVGLVSTPEGMRWLSTNARTAKGAEHVAQAMLAEFGIEGTVTATDDEARPEPGDLLRIVAEGNVARVVIAKPAQKPELHRYDATVELPATLVMTSTVEAADEDGAEAEMRREMNDWSSDVIIGALETGLGALRYLPFEDLIFGFKRRD